MRSEQVKRFENFKEACDQAPEGTFEFSQNIYDKIKELADTFDNFIKSKHLKYPNDTRYVELLAYLYDYVREQNTDSELSVAEGLGHTLNTATADVCQRVLKQLERDRAALAALRSASAAAYTAQDASVPKE